MTTSPDDEAIRNAAKDLDEVVNLKCEELARRLLGLPDREPFEWTEEREAQLKTPEGRRRNAHLHLTKLRISRAANVELKGTVLAARYYAATWNQIGVACGISKQAAYDRWGEAAARDAAEKRKKPEPAIDAEAAVEKARAAIAAENQPALDAEDLLSISKAWTDDKNT